MSKPPLTEQRLRDMYDGKSYYTDIEVKLLIAELLEKRAVIREILTKCMMEENRTANMFNETMRGSNG